MSELSIPVLILGACIGSFLNVVIYRLPLNESIVFPGSHCPSCSERLNQFDLIPIFSWLFLRARCRYCNKKISIKYPFIELLTSILFLISYKVTLFFNTTNLSILVILFGWILLSILVCLSFIDIEHMILPNSLTFGGSILGLCFILLVDLFKNKSIGEQFNNHLFSYLIVLFGVYSFSLLVKFIIKKPGLGEGDAKLFAMSAAWLGSIGFEVTITLSFILCGFFALFGLFSRRIKRGQYIPFGPFICFSTFLTWTLGPYTIIDFLGDVFWWRSI
tara:strand:+ start:19 stop:843 length:825 start_codon:yes stop_codon:yes gene_type:complete